MILIDLNLNDLNRQIQIISTLGQSLDGSPILWVSPQMAAPYYISITRWQHNIIFQSTDGSTILWVNPQMAARYYNSIIRWQHNIIFQSTDGSTILWVNPQMAAQYISITRWQLGRSCYISTSMGFNQYCNTACMLINK